MSLSIPSRTMSRGSANGTRSTAMPSAAPSCAANRSSKPAPVAVLYGRSSSAAQTRNGGAGVGEPRVGAKDRKVGGGWRRRGGEQQRRRNTDEAHRVHVAHLLQREDHHAATHLGVLLQFLEGAHRAQ